LASPIVLVAAAVVNLVTAVLYAHIGRLVLRRDVGNEGRLANAMFATWWISLGLVEAIVGVFAIPGAFVQPDFAFTVALVNALLILLAIAVWSLLAYLIYLYTGSNRAFWPLTIAYAILGFGLLWYIAWLQPSGFQETAIGTQLTYANTPPAWLQTILSLAFAVPAFLAAIAYGSLYFRIQGADARYRVAMVSGSFIVWFGWSLVSSLTGLTRTPSLLVTAFGDLIGLAAPLLVLAAYRPPRFVEARLAARRAQETGVGSR
jgi:hypothetical protein